MALYLVDNKYYDQTGPRKGKPRRRALKTEINEETAQGIVYHNPERFSIVDEGGTVQPLPAASIAYFDKVKPKKAQAQEVRKSPIQSMVDNQPKEVLSAVGTATVDDDLPPANTNNESQGSEGEV